MRKLISVIMLMAGMAWGQANGVNTAYMTTPAPPGVMNDFATASGVTGQTSYCYWVVAVYNIGMVAPQGPVCLQNANATLTGGNLVTVTWQSPSDSVIGYWVLRGTNSTFPGTGTTAIHAAILAATTFSQTDTSNTLNAMTFTGVLPASAQWQINNKDATTPVVQLANVADNASVGVSVVETPSAVNHVQIVSGATGVAPIIRVGSAVDTNAGITISPRGTGTVTVVGGTAGSTVSISGQTTATGTDQVNILAGNAAGTAIKNLAILAGTPNTSGNNRMQVGAGATTKATFNANLTTYFFPNYVASTGGSNNAITITFTDSAGTNITQQGGFCFYARLSNTLQIGANTISLNGGSNFPLKKHTAPGSDIAVGYGVSGLLHSCWDPGNSAYLDMSQ